MKSHCTYQQGSLNGKAQQEEGRKYRTEDDDNLTRIGGKKRERERSSFGIHGGILAHPEKASIFSSFFPSSSSSSYSAPIKREHTVSKSEIQSSGKHPVVLAVFLLFPWGLPTFTGLLFSQRTNDRAWEDRRNDRARRKRTISRKRNVEKEERERTTASERRARGLFLSLSLSRALFPPPKSDPNEVSAARLGRDE